MDINAEGWGWGGGNCLIMMLEQSLATNILGTVGGIPNNYSMACGALVLRCQHNIVSVLPTPHIRVNLSHV